MDRTQLAFESNAKDAMASAGRDLAAEAGSIEAYALAARALARAGAQVQSNATIDVATTYQGRVLPPRKYACAEARPRRETRNPSVTDRTM